MPVAATETASIVPSAAVASTVNPGASRSIACRCSELTISCVSPVTRASTPPGTTVTA